jgi:diguanylate cyclase (GGDEF)-like protein
MADSADFLLQRQVALEQALKDQGSGLSSLLSRTPPIPAALVLIESPAVRERYLKLLQTADIDIDAASDARDALARLAARIHALLFTDRLDLIKEARLLSTGSATHIVFICGTGENAPSEGLRAGANAIMPDEARGEMFWAHLTMARRIVSFAESLQSAVTDNRVLSTVDELTRVGNRRYFEHQWAREVARAVRFARPLSLMICDIDHFKDINDRHGHLTGDAVLTEFGERLTHGLRLGEDWVARIGGEEFAIVLPETGRFEARAIAERLRARINAAMFLSASISLPVTASFGFCGLELPVQRRPDLKDRMLMVADSAMYDSKRAGRNCVTEGLLGTVATGGSSPSASEFASARASGPAKTSGPVSTSMSASTSAPAVATVAGATAGAAASGFATASGGAVSAADAPSADRAPAPGEVPA